MDYERAETAVAPSGAADVFRLAVSARDDAADGRRLVHSAHQLGFTSLTTCRATRLYFLQGRLTAEEAHRLGHQLLVDPVTEELTVQRWPPATAVAERPFTVEVTFLPGVTNPPADNLLHAAHLLGFGGVARAATGWRYELGGDLDEATVQRVAAELLANPVVQRFVVNRPIAPPFVRDEVADATVETIAVRGAADDALLAISEARRLSLDLQEMQAIRRYYEGEGRDPTDVELEMLAQTWSEHCVHKTFKAVIEYVGPPPGAAANAATVRQRIDGLLATYIRAATEKVNRPWVRSAFVDNAGIIAFDAHFDLACKVETHNHPSALEPFGGANTGIGGVVRDVLGVSARPIANTDVLCFGPPHLDHDDLPQGVLHPQRIAAGVVEGIEDYGNKMGIPTVNGSIHYHPGYTANPLVYCGCLGILPHGSNPTAVQPGDLIVAIGGRTGRDGLRGATFSSMEMDVATSEIAGTAVQIGNPIMEKQVQEVILRARDEQLYHAITDCGAGGFSSAVGEMGEKVGARVQLQNVALKYPGLRPWEIWLSEAQERMVLAVPPTAWERLQTICAGQDVEATVLGTFEPSGRLQIEYGERRVGDLTMDFLHDGLPQRHLRAAWSPGDHSPAASAAPLDAQAALLALLAHPDIRSKEDVIRCYDHEVQGGTAVKPLVGVGDHGPADAAVIVPQDAQLAQADAAGAVKGVALGNGICPAYGEIDPYAMAWAAIDEALRNVVAVGADPDQVAILDNFCWGNPNLPDRLGALVRCAQGCYDAAVAYNTPFISGKDSLNNEYSDAGGEKHAIPGTLLISAVGIVPDVARAVTMDLKRAGNFLFIVGDTRAELGGSHLALVGGRVREQHRRAPSAAPHAPETLRRLHAAMQQGLVQACHDCAEGGIGVAVAEMCIAGGLGAEVQLVYAPRDAYWAYAADDAILFAESLTRFLVEVRPEDADAFRAALGDVPHECFGVIGGERLRINGRPDAAEPLVDLALPELEQAWRGHLSDFAARSPEPTATKTAAATEPAQRERPFALILRPKVLILHANGTNRDHDAALACTLAGGDPEIVHVNQLLGGARALRDYHMLVIPGGFSYGDDLGAGVLWALDLRHRLGGAVRRFINDGRPVLGICNGFQALVKAGLLPGQPFSSPSTELAGGGRAVTLTHNASGRFECRWVYLRANPQSPCLFTEGVEELIYCPVAHGEGRVAVRYAAVAEELQRQGLVALTYARPDGAAVAYPANPNGSVLEIAGLCNQAGNVLGLMPHPENHLFPWQHPRGEQGMPGLRLFANGVKRARE